MKVLAIYLLIFGLTVSPVMAGKNQAKDDKKVATTEPCGAPNAAAAAFESSPKPVLIFRTPARTRSRPHV